MKKIVKDFYDYSFIIVLLLIVTVARKMIRSLNLDEMLIYCIAYTVYDKQVKAYVQTWRVLFEILPKQQILEFIFRQNNEKSFQNFDSVKR